MKFTSHVKYDNFIKRSLIVISLSSIDYLSPYLVKQNMRISVQNNCTDNDNTNTNSNKINVCLIDYFHLIVSLDNRDFKCIHHNSTMISIGFFFKTENAIN